MIRPLHFRGLVTLGVLALLAFSASPARAQEYVVGATAEVASGMNAGSAGAQFGFQRAWTQVRLGADFHVDEFPSDVMSAAVIAEVKPHGPLGADFRWVRMVTPKSGVFIGGIGFIVPKSLLGPTVGFQYRIPIASSFALTVGPTMNFFAIGTDLPDGSVIWEGLVHIGVRADVL